MRIVTLIFLILCTTLYADDETYPLPFEVDEEASDQPILCCNRDGISLKSADGCFVFNMSALLQVDARAVIPDYVAPGADNFFVRRARLIFEGTVGSGFSYRLMPDFAGREAQLFDAWIQYDFNRSLVLRFGKARPPLGLERLQQEGDLKFIQRGLPSDLVPIREIGLMLCGRLFDERLEFEVGVFNGTPDFTLSVFDANNAKDLEGRFFYYPFKNMGWSGLDDFAIGCAGSWGVRTVDDDIEGFFGAELPFYVSPATLIFFRYRPECVADGCQWRLIPQGYWYSGPWGIMWEYALSSQKVKNVIIEQPITNKAWQIQLSYEITGEKNTFGRIIPLTTFDLCAGTWGAFEFVARHAELTISPRAFPIYADPERSAQYVNNTGIGLNWYPNLFVKISANYEFTYFRRGWRDERDRPNENLLIVQAQVRF